MGPAHDGLDQVGPAEIANADGLAKVGPELNSRGSAGSLAERCARILSNARIGRIVIIGLLWNDYMVSTEVAGRRHL